MGDNFLGEKKGHVYHITINRPDKRNALTFEMLQEIADMVEGLAKDPEIRAILLKGAGKMFSSGVDLGSLAGLLPLFTADEAAGGGGIRDLVAKGQRCYNLLESIEIPIICAIHNRVQGMAVELVLACDIRLMSEECAWGLQEVKFGLIPDLGGNTRLSRLVGPARAMEVNMTGRLFTARQALQWGLASYLYPEEKLFEEAEKLAIEIASNAPLAVGSIKKVVRRGLAFDQATQLEMEGFYQSICGRSEDFREGVNAMLEKRAPVWKRK
ncbi:MAG TPA: enoyl-CoA hydratase [Spirochaetes bacterium]|nr:enoyl-CoA hydratase [Spirochaetota bacterium]